jgi:hypothetical protein
VGEALRQQALDLHPGLVRGGGQQVVRRVLREVGRQQDHVGEVEAAAGNQVKDRREPSRQACDPDRLEGGLFGELQIADTVGRHRRVGRRQVELAGVDFGDVGEQVGGGATSLAGVGGGAVQQGGIGEVRPRIIAYLDGGKMSRAVGGG